MRRLIPLVALLAVALGGCDTMRKASEAWQAVQSAEVSPRAVNITVNAYNGVVRTATNYVRLPPCQTTTSKVCSDDRAVALITPAVRSGRIARDELLAVIERSPTVSISKAGAYDTLEGAVNVIRGTLQQYGYSQEVSK
jgi:hypothetical protein